MSGDGREELRERVARALYESELPVTRLMAGPDCRDRYRRLADAAIDAIQPPTDGAHEMQCPSCGATIRARMADHVEIRTEYVE